MTDIQSIAIPLAVIGFGLAVGAVFSALDRLTLARGGPADVTPEHPGQAAPLFPPRPGKPERRVGAGPGFFAIGEKGSCRCRVDRPAVWRTDRA